MNSADDVSAARTEIAIAVVERDGQFLIGLRPPDVPLPGYWEFPGGKIKPGESPADAAIRECVEETGLVVRVTGEYPTAEHDYDHAPVRLHFFACEAVKEQASLPTRFRWVQRSDLARYRFPPANAEILAAISGGDAR